jgi:cysteinyl-tRNA synthetase
MRYLGAHFDIHGGGLDLVFPHHENEVVQSESYTGVPFASYWLHNGLLTKDGKKISKSDPGSVVLMSDLLKAHAPDTLRALLLSSHYRRPIDYGPTRLAEIERGLQTFYRAFERFEELTGIPIYSLEAPTQRNDTPDEPALPAEVAEHRQQFLEAMDDDFNTGGALGELFEIVHAVNRISTSPAAIAGNSPEYLAAMTVLRELSQILGLFRKPPAHPQASGDGLTTPLLELLLELRARLRKDKNFALADEVRNRLTALGVVLEDRPDGTKWRIEPRR